MIKMKIKVLNNKYIISDHTKINTFYVLLTYLRVPQVEYHWRR
jgi:hypothetical protein